MNTRLQERRIDLDWLRVLAFSLLILFHSGMMFNTWDWHVKNNVTSELPELFMTFLHQWRMPLLFFISGAAVCFLMDKLSVRRYVKNRLLRLLLPLVFGMFVIIPPQVYYERLFQGQHFASFIDFYKSVLTFTPYPEGNFSWHHLWYIPYIFVFSIITLPLFRVLKTARGSAVLQSFIDRFTGSKMIVLWFFPLAISQIVLRPYWPGDANNLIDDWSNFAWTLTFFVYGFLLASHTTIWDTIEKIRRPMLIISVISFIVIAVIWEVDFQMNGMELVLYRSLRSFHAWCWIVTILGFGRKYLQKKNSYLTYANEAVYPFYILHQTITVAIGYYVAGWQIDIMPKFLLVAGGTIAGCFIIYEGLIKRNNVLRLVFGMKWQAKQAASASVPAAAVAESIQ